jgi:hypothetical protein
MLHLRDAHARLTVALYPQFARDSADLYGSDYFAQKAAANEMRAQNALIECGVQHLHTTLSCMFMIGGHVLIATAIAPIASSTLCYGSDDGTLKFLCLTCLQADWILTVRQAARTCIAQSVSKH